MAHVQICHLIAFAALALLSVITPQQGWLEGSQTFIWSLGFDSMLAAV